MRIKKESRMSWQEAPDIISPEDLSNITGIAIQSCRKLFDSPDFPSMYLFSSFQCDFNVVL